MQTFKSPAFHKGIKAKQAEIVEIGFTSAREKFNNENPPGQKWKGTEDGLQFALGEFHALETAAH